MGYGMPCELSPALQPRDNGSRPPCPRREGLPCLLLSVVPDGSIPSVCFCSSMVRPQPNAMAEAVSLSRAFFQVSSDGRATGVDLEGRAERAVARYCIGICP